MSYKSRLSAQPSHTVRPMHALAGGVAIKKTSVMKTATNEPAAYKGHLTNRLTSRLLWAAVIGLCPLSLTDKVSAIKVGHHRHMASVDVFFFYQLYIHIIYIIYICVIWNSLLLRKLPHVMFSPGTQVCYSLSWVTVHAFTCTFNFQVT